MDGCENTLHLANADREYMFEERSTEYLLLELFALVQCEVPKEQLPVFGLNNAY